MKKLLDDVAAFHKAAELPIYSGIAARAVTAGPPTEEEMRLRLRLLLEEFEELFEAHDIAPAGGVVHSAFTILRAAIDQITQPKSKRMDEIADALGDSIYIHVGTALTYGIPLDRVWDAIQKANMAKFPGGKALRRADGKITKPEGWQPPNIPLALTLPTEASWPDNDED